MYPTITKNYICCMTHTATLNNKIHQGRNVKRFRAMLGIKQDALANELGDNWNRQKIPLLEQKETIDLPLLQQISAVLKIPVEVMENFDAEQAVNIISNNTFDNCNQPASFFYNSTINPIEKLVQFHEEKIALYERMLRKKDEMTPRLEKLLEKK